eukprot:15330195-Ditylum_brightwellii.AAC.1
MMAGKKEIAIVLATKTSHTMWRKSTVALAPNLRVAVTVADALQGTDALQGADTLQAADAFQAAAALVFVLCQTAASKVMTITMWRTPTWA